MTTWPPQPSSLPYHGTVVVPLPAPRRCWTLIEDVGTGVWEVADFDIREAIAVAMPTPRWDGQQWVDPGAPGLLLTWSPNSAPLDDEGFLWMTEESLYWSEAAATRAAREHTKAARAERRRQARAAAKAGKHVPSPPATA